MIAAFPGMKLLIKNRRTFATQTVRTLSGLMLKWDEDITDATYAERLGRNDGMSVWLDADSMVVGSRRLPQELETPVEYGDEIQIKVGRKEERGIWLIAPPLTGDHCRLIRREN